MLEVRLKFRKRDVSTLVKIDTFEDFLNLTLCEICETHLVEHLPQFVLVNIALSISVY